MKKSKLAVYCLGFIIMSVVLVLTSCGSKDSSSSDAESLEQNYKKACELKDFSTAYEIVDKLKEETSKAKVKNDEYEGRINEYVSEYKEAKKKSDEAERYVVLQEALYVLEERGEDGLFRIAGIVKEHNADWLYSELINVTKSIGNEDLTKKIEKMDPHRAILSLETSTVSGPLKGYFKVLGTEAKIEKGVLTVSLERIKQGVPDRNDPYYYFKVIISDEINNPIIGIWAESRFSGLYIKTCESISLEFNIDKETYGMKKFSIVSEKRKY